MTRPCPQCGTLADPSEYCPGCNWTQPNGQRFASDGDNVIYVDFGAESDSTPAEVPTVEWFIDDTQLKEWDIDKDQVERVLRGLPDPDRDH